MIRRESLQEKKKRFKQKIIMSLVLGLIVSTIYYFMKHNGLFTVLVFVLTILIFLVADYVRQNLKKTARIKKLEEIFPEFLQLMSSNLRAGMTIDRSMLLSARPEFAPLDSEILQTGRDIATGKDIERALLDLSKRVGSDRIHRTILLIISGIRAGGDIAILLEETAVGIRERTFVEKKAASNVLMYIIFIFMAVAIFSPFLFSLSTILVEVLTSILGQIPDIDVSSNMPFTLSKISVSATFVKYFSLSFMITIAFFASLVLGLVGKGEEKQGLRYLPVMIIISIIIFYLSRLVISSVLSGLI